jgi:hypothetical protein
MFRNVTGILASSVTGFVTLSDTVTNVVPDDIKNVLYALAAVLISFATNWLNNKIHGWLGKK